MTCRVPCTCSAHNGFLTAKGLQEAAQRRVDAAGLDAMGLPRYLDKVGSVSALAEADGQITFWDDQLIEEQHRRFLNGS